MKDRQWTPLIGLKRMLMRLLIRSAIALVLWTAVIWISAPVLNFLVPHWAIFGVTALVLLAPGVAIGHGLSRNLTDIAGMAGLPVAFSAVAFGWAVVILGVGLANMIRPLGDWQYGLTMMATCFWATAWTLNTTAQVLLKKIITPCR